MRHSADVATYLVIVLVRALATFSPGTECWQAHKPRAAAMNRTLAKLTDLIGRHSTSAYVMSPPDPDGSVGARTNEDIARVFGEIADLLELGDENTYRVIAYRNAERELRGTGYDIPALLAAGEPLPKMPGIGTELAAKIREIWQTGTSRTLERLRQDYPPGILELLRLPGVGPKRVRLFYRELGVGSLEELERAIRAGRLRALGGFGPKSEQRILEAIMAVKSRHARRLQVPD